MNLLVDTGVFSAALTSRGRPDLADAVHRLPGNHLFLAVQTVAELRYGALVAGWSAARRDRLETAIATTTVLPITDELLHTVAHLRATCRRLGHPLADPRHHADLWIAAAAIEADLALLSADRIFDSVPGLRLA